MAKLIILLTALAIAFPAAVQGATPAVQDSLWAIADDVMEMIVAGDVESVVDVLHYPPSYSKEQIASDSAALRDALAFLLGKFGELKDFERFSGEALCYDIALSAGDVAYWESLSPLSTVELMYAGDFGKFGPGIVSISLFETKSGVDLRAVVFRLAASAPKAREKVIDIYVEMARRQAESLGEDLPENLRELISASVPKLGSQEGNSPTKPPE